ncbi:snurportin-1 [Hyposmocoma kahamanoa]|uniref:snurportin-1 n=1 Tax=Hyposmocoma kahamanoa TaxID=1477025 RepID=UPI000E6D82C5|nr:snurportin-1 [Hyposmocoma kahamanoa]
MEEVVEKLSDAVISKEPTEEDKSNFEGLYKNWGKLGNQEERRREILEVQKSNRNTKLDLCRGILDLVNTTEEENIFHNKNKAYYRPNIYVAGFHRTPTNYSNVLMLSEWMIEKPFDFADNWYMVPCPKAVRVLVVSNHGRTKCYTKYGSFKFERCTALPGGNPNWNKKKNNCCVLDCFYYDNNRIMFVLDILAWNCQPMTDGETEFRHYWLQTHLGELPGLKVISRMNQIIFKILPKIPCDTESLNNFLQTYPPFENHIPQLDGLLFYHKRAHYFAGQTPLVGWLYPFMVPEVLGEDIKISPAYELDKPENYTDQADFIIKFEKKYNKRLAKNTRRCSKMDTAEAEQGTERKGRHVGEDKQGKAKEDTIQATMETGLEVQLAPPDSNTDQMESEEIESSAKDSDELESSTTNAAAALE